MSTAQTSQVPGHLVSAEWLERHRADPGIRIVDATVFLSFDESGAHIASGAEAFAGRHLPGAVFLDLSAERREIEQAEDRRRFAEAAAHAGLSNDDTIVVYDQVNGIWATRLWWQLRLVGARDVRVLDGGLSAYERAGFALSSGPSAPPSHGTFVFEDHPELLASTEEVERATGDRAVLLIDALEPSSYAAGHIPGAVSLPFPALYDEDGTLKGKTELRENLERLGALDPAVRPVTYCGGGIAATTAAFALAQAGRDDVQVYSGSLNAWRSDPARPLENAGE